MYEGHLNNHFETINSIKLNRITTETVEKFISEKQNKEMNITTLRKIIVTFNQVMSYGVRHRYIDYNPVRDAERPKRKKEKGNAHDKTAIQVLTPNEINALLSVIPNRKYKTLFTLAIFSGARQGELLGLKWSDVDWDNNQIHIQRTFNKKTWYEPKSKTSYRRIDLGPLESTKLPFIMFSCVQTTKGGVTHENIDIDTKQGPRTSRSLNFSFGWLNPLASAAPSNGRCDLVAPKRQASCRRRCVWLGPVRGRAGYA
jgi:integrase